MYLRLKQLFWQILSKALIHYQMIVVINVHRDISAKNKKLTFLVQPKVTTNIVCKQRMKS